jgi:hypothetical protein
MDINDVFAAAYEGVSLIATLKLIPKNTPSQIEAYQDRPYVTEDELAEMRGRGLIE